MEETSKLKVKSIRLMSEAFPTQWGGVLGDGRSLYVRYKNNYLTVEVTNIVGKDDQDNNYYPEKLIVSTLDGYMSYYEMTTHLASVFDFKGLKDPSCKCDDIAAR